MRYQKSIQLKVLIAIAVSLLAVSTLAMVIEYYSIDKKSQKEFDVRVNEMGRLFSMAMASPLRWQGQDPVIRASVNAMMADENILSASVYSLGRQGEKFLFNIHRDSQGAIQTQEKEAPLPFPDSVQREIPVFQITSFSRAYVEQLIRTPFLKESKNNIVGVIKVDYSTQILRDARQAALTSSVSKTLALFVVIFVVLFVVLRRLIVTPVTQVNVMMKHVAEGNYDDAIPAHSTDEVGEMVDSFEKMRQCIHDKIEHIEDLNHNLEKKVEHRTKDLLDEVRLRIKSEVRIRQLLDAQISISDSVIEAYKKLEQTTEMHPKGGIQMRELLKNQTDLPDSVKSSLMDESSAMDPKTS